MTRLTLVTTIANAHGHEDLMNRRLALGTLAAGIMVASSARAQEAAFVRDVFARINQQRVRNGLQPCTYSATLEKAGQAHAEWMARNRKMEHLQPAPASFEEHRTCNHHPINRAINAGYIGWDDVFRVERTPTGAIVHARPDADDHVGEIISAGWNAGHPATQPAPVVQGWMNSPGHRKEILTGHYREMGVGVACTPDGKDTFWCVVFGDPGK